MRNKAFKNLHRGAVLLLCCTALVLSLTLVCVVTSASHDCTGLHCPVCLCLKQTILVLGGLASAGICAGLGCPPNTAQAFFAQNSATACLISTPVALKVRKND